jgi:TBC1 domain family protein 5
MVWLYLIEILQVFLLFQNADQSSWFQTLADSRSAYDSLRVHFLRAIDNPDEVDSDIDPLSEHEEVCWSFGHSYGWSD